MNKIDTNNYETIRRFIIVQMNNAGIGSLDRARALGTIAQGLLPTQLEATARAIDEWRAGTDRFRSTDLVHDIMGMARHDDGFVPRIDALAAVYSD